MRSMSSTVIYQRLSSIIISIPSPRNSSSSSSAPPVPPAPPPSSPGTLRTVLLFAAKLLSLHLLLRSSPTPRIPVAVLFCPSSAPLLLFLLHCCPHPAKIASFFRQPHLPLIIRRARPPLTLHPLSSPTNTVAFVCRLAPPLHRSTAPPTPMFASTWLLPAPHRLSIVSSSLANTTHTTYQGHPSHNTDHIHPVDSVDRIGRIAPDRTLVVYLPCILHPCSINAYHLLLLPTTPLCAVCCILCAVSCALCPVPCVLCAVSCVLCPAVGRLRATGWRGPVCMCC